jgi:hypothetical protein
MAGSFTFSPAPGMIPLGRPADRIVAARSAPSQSPPWEGLPGVRPLSVEWFEGARPPEARFRYSAGDPNLPSDLPARIEDSFPLDAHGPGVVLADDLVAVFRFGVSGAVDILFEGYAQVPQADYGAGGEQVTFTAVGVPIREFDTPLGGALTRSSATPLVPNADVRTDNPARFNPEGGPNATPEWADEDETDSADSILRDPFTYPTFLGPDEDDQVGGATLRAWTLPMAVAYCCCVGNPKQQYTAFPGQAALADVLYAAVPAQEAGPIFIGRTGTYSKGPIEAPDLDVMGMAWPDAVERLIAPHGFGMAWRLAADSGLKTSWRLDVYRGDDTGHVKVLRLQDAGEALDPAASNVQAMSLARDGHALADVIEVEGDPVVVEASFLLTPLFRIDGTDAANLDRFVLGNPACVGAYLDAYRLWGLDEAGEGHWDVVTSGWDDPTTIGGPVAPSLKSILATKLVQGGAAPPDGGWVPRRRRPLSPVVSVDPDTMEPYKAELWVSFNYGRTAPGVWSAGTKIPAVWDGISGLWDRVVSGWSLLDDRVGVRLRGANGDANDVHVGARDGFQVYGGAFSSLNGGNPLTANNGTLDVVNLCAPTAVSNGQDMPVFRLTCAIAADVRCGAKADGTAASPTKFAVVRRYDAEGRFRRKVVSQYSHFAAADEVMEDTAVVDETDEARAMANASLRAHQFAVFGGSATVPRVTLAYRVGDKLRGVSGRGIDFNSAAGQSDGASPVYPTVVGVRWDFEGGQKTTLTPSDKRAEYAPRRGRQRRPRFHPDASG